jgi:hypothetical protein
MEKNRTSLDGTLKKVLASSGYPEEIKDKIWKSYQPINHDETTFTIAKNQFLMKE